MFLQPYQIIKAQLATISKVKLITWFNNQIDAGILHTVPAILIGFPEDLNPETLNRQDQQAELVTRVSLVSKLLTNKDGSVNELKVEAHEVLADEVFDHLDGFNYDTGGAAVLNSMMRVRVKIDTDTPGWIITHQDFACVLYLESINPDYRLIDKPAPDIEASTV